MNKPRHLARPFACAILVAGSILATLSALAPLPVGAWQLSGSFLLLGLLPYVVYVSLANSLDGCPLVAAGVVLLAADLMARFGLQIVYTPHADLLPAVWLAAALTGLALPAGVLLGKPFSRYLGLPAERIGHPW